MISAGEYFLNSLLVCTFVCACVCVRVSFECLIQAGEGSFRRCNALSLAKSD